MTVTSEDVYALAPYAETLGVRFQRLAADGVEAELDCVHALSTVGGGLHGGALMGLADVSAAVCAALNGPENAVPATMQSSTNFLRPLHGRIASAVAQPLHAGRTTVTVEVNISDDEGRLCVRVVQTIAVRAARG
ncbi:PaaI family thioesterase [Streptomyces sp. NPDC086549]|uniref:PaaI family thioesterase n=1 Tax=Streptomyces sp. NPDC086549 TaxID=3365752 RepID=UPI003825B161